MLSFDIETRCKRIMTSNGFTLKEYEAACSIACLMNTDTNEVAGMKRECKGSCINGPERKMAKTAQADVMPGLSAYAYAEHLAHPKLGLTASEVAPEKEPSVKDMAYGKAETMTAKALESGAAPTPGGEPEKLKQLRPLASQGAGPDLKPPPFFYYIDHSQERDTDPPTLLTESGQIPSFPAKMHAILSKPNLKHIVAWDDHGRSFKILDQQQFEQHILPKYFQQSKIASFYRLINGWNFRRIQSKDNPNYNSYYEENFLRNMPWLCKRMKRPKIGKKLNIQMGKLGRF